MDHPASSFEAPAAAGRRANLLLALLLMSVFPVFLLSIPIQTHAVKLDLPRLPETIVPANPYAPDSYFMTTTVARHATLSVDLDLELEPPRRLHELVVTPHDQVLFNGRAVDLTGLRARLDLIGVREEWVDFRPDPNARYELFAEILAVAKRARLERLRLDSRPFRETLDEDAPSWRRPVRTRPKPRP